jgi:hypothetical protein
MKVYQSIFNFNEIKINKVKIKTIWLRLTRILKFWKKKINQGWARPEHLSANILRDLPRQRTLTPRDSFRAISDDQVRAPGRPSTLKLCLLKDAWSNLSPLMKNWVKIDEKKPPFAYTPKLMYASASTLGSWRPKISDQIALKTKNENNRGFESKLI